MRNVRVPLRVYVSLITLHYLVGILLPLTRDKEARKFAMAWKPRLLQDTLSFLLHMAVVEMHGRSQQPCRAHIHKQ